MMNKNLNFFTLDNGLKVIIYSDKKRVKYTVELITLFNGFDRYFV